MMNQEINKKYQKKYYLENKEKLTDNMKDYYSLNKNKMLEQMKKWRDDNSRYYIDYYKENKNKLHEYRKLYNKTQYGRAAYLLNRYKQSDKKHNRGEVDFDAQWIIDNIFSKPCAHCGETDWLKIGCNRLDNSKGHTKDNVEPCCGKCNRKIH